MCLLLELPDCIQLDGPRGLQFSGQLPRAILAQSKVTKGQPDGEVHRPSSLPSDHLPLVKGVVVEAGVVVDELVKSPDGPVVIT